MGKADLKKLIFSGIKKRKETKKKTQNENFIFKIPYKFKLTSVIKNYSENQIFRFVRKYKKSREKKFQKAENAVNSYFEEILRRNKKFLEKNKSKNNFNFGKMKFSKL